MTVTFVPEVEEPVEEEAKPLYLTPAHLRAAYLYLSAIPPFSKWKMPDAERIKFKVNSATMSCGMYEPDPHRISVSRLQNAHHTAVLMTTAHEMLHLHCERNGISHHEDHNDAFNELALEVCKAMGWLPWEF